MSATDGISFDLIRGPFQNNGASPWYTNMSIGTPPQEMKINIDSGTNNTWVTSTLCPPDSCIHYGGGRFDWEASETFQFTDCLQRPFSFGPWGTMQVESGSERLTLPDTNEISANMYFSAAYSGSQFEQLNWDGGIGLPSSSAYVEGRTTFIFHELMMQGIVDETLPYASFYTDTSSAAGTSQMGGFDPTKIDTTYGGLWLPYSVYSDYPNVEYMWSSDLTDLKVGNVEIGPGIAKVIGVDTGASQFKGDDVMMQQILDEIAAQGNPTIEITAPGGTITVGADIYKVLIEAGPDAGKTIPQFQPLGLDRVTLVGSVLLDHCYTVFEYGVVKCSATMLSLKPNGVYLFNKVGGPSIIRGTAEIPGATQPVRGRAAFGPGIA